MKQDFEELFEAVKNNRKYSAYVGSLQSEDYIKEIQAEYKELMQAFDSKDYENLKEELGDFFWDFLSFIIMLDEEGKIKKQEIIKDVLNKFKERKPHIFEKRKISLEEEKEQFLKAKKIQKERVKNE